MIEVKCPLCGETMEYRNINNIHIWVCPECPAVLMELYSIEDLLEVKNMLK